MLCSLKASGSYNGPDFCDGEERGASDGSHAWLRLYLIPPHTIPPSHLVSELACMQAPGHHCLWRHVGAQLLLRQPQLLYVLSLAD